MAAKPASEPICSRTCGRWTASGSPPPAAWRAVISGTNLSQAYGRRGSGGASALFAREHALCGELRDDRRQTGRIALVDALLDAREGLLDPVGVQHRALGGDDLLGLGLARPLVGVEEVLVDLLARPRAHDLDGDVHVRLLP